MVSESSSDLRIPSIIRESLASSENPWSRPKSAGRLHLTRSLRARQAEILGIPGIPGWDRPWFGVGGSDRASASLGNGSSISDIASIPVPAERQMTHTRGPTKWKWKWKWKWKKWKCKCVASAAPRSKKLGTGPVCCVIVDQLISNDEKPSVDQSTKRPLIEESNRDG